MTGDSLRLLLSNTETFLKSHMVYSRTEAVIVHCGQNPQNRVYMTALVLQQYLSLKLGANGTVGCLIPSRDLRDHMRADLAVKVRGMEIQDKKRIGYFHNNNYKSNLHNFDLYKSLTQL